MTFTTASGLLPAGIAVYVQREPNGIGLEMRYPVGLEDLTSLWERGSEHPPHRATDRARAQLYANLGALTRSQLHLADLWTVSRMAHAQTIMRKLRSPQANMMVG